MHRNFCLWHRSQDCRWGGFEEEEEVGPGAGRAVIVASVVAAVIDAAEAVEVDVVVSIGSSIASGQGPLQ